MYTIWFSCKYLILELTLIIDYVKHFYSKVDFYNLSILYYFKFYSTICDVCSIITRIFTLS